MDSFTFFGSLCKWLSCGTPAFLLNFIFVVTKEKRQYFCLTCTREDFKRQCIVLELGMRLILSNIPFPSTPPHTPRCLSQWLPCLLSLGSSSACAVSLYVKKSSLLILWSVTRLPLRNGQWATGPGLPYRSIHSCPPLPEWSHITYLWSRTELVSAYYWEQVSSQSRLFWYFDFEYCSHQVVEGGDRLHRQWQLRQPFNDKL